MTRKSTAAAAAAQPNPIDQLEAAIAHERDIEQRIEDGREEIVRLSDDNGALRAPMDDLAMKLRDAQQRLDAEQTRTGDDNPFLRERIAEMEVNLTRMRTTFDQNEARRDALNKELWQLQAVELPAARSGGSLAQVLAQQQRVAEAAQKVASLHGLIAEQERALGEIAWQDAGQYVTQLEDLHAAVAAGTVTDREHDEREAQIIAQRDEAQRMNDAAGIRLDRLRGAIAGLERQAAAAQEELDDLRGKTKPVLVRFLNSEGHRLCGEYEQAAEKLIDAFLRLVAVSELAKEAGSGEIFLHGNWNEMKLPAVYRRPEAPSQLHPTGFMFDAYGAVFGSGGQYRDKLAEERDRLGELGVDI